MRPAARIPSPLLLFTAYWALAFAISWTAYVVSRTAYFYNGASDGTGAQALLHHPLPLLAKFGPTIAGMIILTFAGAERKGSFWNALRHTGGLWPNVIAIVAPGLLTLISLFIAAKMQGLNVSSLVTSFSVGAAAYWLSLRTFLGGGMGEEVGLRGVALPLLLECAGPRKASVAIGLLWALWHLPVLLGKPWLVWVGQTVLTTSISIILTYVWFRTRGALLIAILFHGAVNGWAAYAGTWMPALEAPDVWQVARLVFLLAISLSLLPLNWNHNCPITKGLSS